MTHAVVLRTFLTVGKDAVSLVYLLELLFGALFLADIGVIFFGQGAVSLLNLLFCSRFRNIKDIVIVFRTHIIACRLSYFIRP